MASVLDHMIDMVQALFEDGGTPDGHQEIQKVSQPTSVELISQQQIKAIRLRLSEVKGVRIRDSTILWALHSPVASGNDDLAYKFLLAMSDASEGILAPYSPSTRLRGAVNRQGVTCFLDSTLFAIFSRLDSFEAMLYNNFPDIGRQKLSFLLRLWVNMLRSGQLITVDITARIQSAIAECGWEDAAEMQQQDASEAFTFITGKLELPLLTLKMDIYHAGKEDEADDHKFINERLLEVAVPEPTEQRKEITLEDCLEEYFNNRIEVRRYLERRGTMNSMKPPTEASIKAAAIHVETIEIDPDESSPATPKISAPPISPRPEMPARARQQSIIQDIVTPSQPGSATNSMTKVPTEASTRSRAGSVRKTVMMPGWQFFSLIPWYTDNTISNDAQIAAHFSSKRPVLGLCLKRYSFKDGRPMRLGTYIDIPVEIGLPHFIQDDAVTDNGAMFGNFKLSLQSVVCHRGNSVDSGHYISLVRGTRAASSDSTEDTKQWLRFDDLAPQRITTVDINAALREETAYLLFYQVMPIDEVSSARSDTDASDTKGGHSTTSLPLSRASTTNMNSGRPSFEITAPESPRGRSSIEGRRPSVISFTDSAISGTSKGHSRNVSKSSSPNRRGSDTGSSGGAGGMVRRLSKLTKRRSRDVSGDHDHQLQKQQTQHQTEPAEVKVQEVSSLSPTSTSAQPQQQPPPKSNTLTVNPPAYGYSGQQASGHKREGSRHRHRLSKHGGTGKQKDLDRECTVM